MYVYTYIYIHVYLCRITPFTSSSLLAPVNVVWAHLFVSEICACMICMHIFVCIYMYVYRICAYMYKCVYTKKKHKNTQTNTNTCTHTNTQIYIFMHTYGFINSIIHDMNTAYKYIKMCKNTYRFTYTYVRMHRLYKCNYINVCINAYMYKYIYILYIYM